MVEYGLGVDLGTTHTAAAVNVGGAVETVRLGGRRPEIPSLVFLREDGEVLVGDAAQRRGEAAPTRLAREFKRRLGDPVPVLLGGTPMSAHALTSRLLRYVTDAVTGTQGSPPARIVLTHPANWGPYKRELLLQAAQLADLDQVTLRTEPEAAAVRFAGTSRVMPGEIIAVYDLGGGTFDAAVLRKTDDGFEVLGEPQGVEQLGGIDFDEAILEHVRGTIGEALGELDLADPSVTEALARLRRECVEAKESLSFDTEAEIAVALPRLHTRVRISRADFEAMIEPALADTVAALRRALRSAGVGAGELRCVVLAGGSARIPLVGSLVSGDLGCPAVADEQPELGIALGAARFSGPEGLPPAAPVSPSPGWPAPRPTAGSPAAPGWAGPSGSGSAVGAVPAGQPAPGAPAWGAAAAGSAPAAAEWSESAQSGSVPGGGSAAGAGGWSEPGQSGSVPGGGSAAGAGGWSEPGQSGSVPGGGSATGAGGWNQSGPSGQLPGGASPGGFAPGVAAVGEPVPGGPGAAVAGWGETASGGLVPGGPVPGGPVPGGSAAGGVARGGAVPGGFAPGVAAVGGAVPGGSGPGVGGGVVSRGAAPVAPAGRGQASAAAGLGGWGVRPAAGDGPAGGGTAGGGTVGGGTVGGGARGRLLAYRWPLIGAFAAVLLTVTAVTAATAWPRDGDKGKKAGGGASGGASRVAVADAALLWSKAVGQVVGEPAAVGAERVFVGGRDGVLRSYRRGDGSLDWELRVGAGLRVAARVGGGAVYASTEAGTVVAVDEAEGEVLWKRDTKTRLEARPAVGEERIYAAGGDGVLYAYVLGEGHYRTRSVWADEGLGTSPVPAGESVVVAGGDGRLHGTSADNEQLWKPVTVGTAVGDPAVVGDAACVPVDDGSVRCVRVSDGGTLPRIALDGVTVSAVAGDDRTLFAAASDGTVSAWDPLTAQMRWRSTGAGSAGFPAVRAGEIDVAFPDGRLVGLDPGTGAERWQYATGDRLSVAPSGDEAGVFAVGDGGTLYALRPPGSASLPPPVTGAPSATATTPEPTTASPSHTRRTTRPTHRPTTTSPTVTWLPTTEPTTEPTTPPTTYVPDRGPSLPAGDGN